jgi:spermidine synthase
MGSFDIEVLACEESAIGLICLRQRGLPSEPGGVVTEITLDHEFLMSSHNTASERALALRALDLHPATQLQVLVGGLGLGYTAWELLGSDRPARVEVVELLPPVIGWLEADLMPLSEPLKADARLVVKEGDVYAQLGAAPRRLYDLILVDVDHSPDERLGEGEGFFYTAAGLERAKAHLAPDGVLGVWSYAESPAFAEAMHRVFREVHVEPLTFENPVLAEPETNWLFFGRT